MAGADDVLAQIAGGARFRERPLEHLGLLGVLAADIDEGAPRAGRIGGDHDPLDQHVGGLLHQFAVLERARLGLVGVAHEVLLDRAVRQEGDLLAHGEARAAAAAQPRSFQLREHLLGSHGECLAQRLVSTPTRIHLERGEPRLVDAAQEQLVRAPLGACGRPAHELPGGQHGATRAQVLEQPGRIVYVKRPDVHPIGRDHRRDVARSQALERPHVHVAAIACRHAHRLQQRVGSAQRAGDVRAHVHAVTPGGGGLEHVVERGQRLQVGRRHAHHAGDLLERLRGAPAVHALRRGERGQRRRARLWICGHARLDLLAQRGRDLDRSRLGYLRGVLGEIDAAIPAGRARPVGEARHGQRGAGHALPWQRLRGRQAAIAGRAHRSMPPRIGSSIAMVAIMSAM